MLKKQFHAGTSDVVLAAGMIGGRAPDHLKRPTSRNVARSDALPKMTMCRAAALACSTTSIAVRAPTNCKIPLVCKHPKTPVHSRVKEV